MLSTHSNDQQAGVGRRESSPGNFPEKMKYYLLTGFMSLVCLAAAAAEEKDIGEPAPIPARHWDGPFELNTTTLVGSYVTVNGWFDPDTATLHGYLSVWSKQPDGSLDYNKYHATTRTLKPADVKEP